MFAALLRRSWSESLSFLHPIKRKRERVWLTNFPSHPRAADEYVDAGVSGAKDSRPELDRLMADVKRRRFDVGLVWKLDRFGRLCATS
jgi:DNA invertase Pin-like site-specific DNA recombinase